MIPLELWTKAYHWAKTDKSILSIENDDSTSYYLPVKDVSKISNDDVTVLNSIRWNTFDQYKKRAFGAWCVEMPKEKSKWCDSVCNCPSFFKKFVCKHVVWLAILNGAIACVIVLRSSKSSFVNTSFGLLFV